MRNVRQAAVPQVQLVTFQLGAEEFGLDVFQVHEILRWQEPTAVPRAPAFVEGVLDVRGTLVPVLDLRRRFELPTANYDDDTRIAWPEACMPAAPGRPAQERGFRPWLAKVLGR